MSVSVSIAARRVRFSAPVVFFNRPLTSWNRPKGVFALFNFLGLGLLLSYGFGWFVVLLFCFGSGCVSRFLRRLDSSAFRFRSCRFFSRLLFLWYVRFLCCWFCLFLVALGVVIWLVVSGSSISGRCWSRFFDYWFLRDGYVFRSRGLFGSRNLLGLLLRVGRWRLSSIVFDCCCCCRSGWFFCWFDIIVELVLRRRRGVWLLVFGNYSFFLWFDVSGFRTFLRLVFSC
jgi:hypothetical protein